MLVGIITTAIGTLLIYAVLAIVKSRWLYVVAPKLYLNTPISDGQIISLEIYNAGLVAEEDVAITFRQACKFELIGTSKSTLSVVGKTISLPKLSKLESITIVLLIEGKAFDPIDIESVESKSTKGKVVESKEKATAIWQNFVVIPILLLVLAFPFVFGTIVGADADKSAIDYVYEKFELYGERKQLAGYKITTRERTIDDVFEAALEKGKISIETVEVLRQGDVLTVTTLISNNMDEPLLFEGYLKSSSGDDGPLDFSDHRFDNFALGPRENRKIKQRAYLPENLSTKFIDNRISVENLAGSSMSISYLMEFK